MARLTTTTSRGTKVMQPTMLKLSGGILLLLSFATQSLVLDYFGGRAASIRTAFLERAVIDKGAQLSELLYLTFPPQLDSSLGGVRFQKIREAAEKRAMSSIMPVVSNDSITQREKIDIANRLRQQAQLVDNYSAYTRFLAAINETDLVFAPAWNDQIDRLERRRDYARYVYLGLYVVGTVMVLVGEVRSSGKQ